MGQAPPAGPKYTRVLHPTGKSRGWGFTRVPVDGEALASAGLEAKFAVIEVKSKQYKVTKDDIVVSDKIEGLEPGVIFACENVHLVGTPEYTVVGRPYVESARVRLQVEEQAKDAKVIIFKKKRRKNYRRKQGFRREVTILRVLGIEE
ncbi:hypothetical protein NSK_001455 [Nannochloropsis salina CCMP1776]|nr:hypothetical protein NSK_001455 [Nannochloropsis salina CCMP1776]|eukprot:TFJ87121.1 hypothetical protein NSK_001455 [Nannochloropsis salina CCMP1776]